MAFAIQACNLFLLLGMNERLGVRFQCYFLHFVIPSISICFFFFFLCNPN